MVEGVKVVDENGDLADKEKYKTPEKVYFECEEGFELDGRNESVCQDDGEWSHTEFQPSCIGDYFS